MDAHGPYPVMLRLDGARCLVVGGGQVAARKVAGLLEAGGQVVVVAPDLEGSLQKLAEQGRVEWVRRGFCRADLPGSRLVIAATDDEGVNAAVAREARRLGIWVNVVDQPDLCDFIAPAVVRRGPVVVACSTGGQSPALARDLRRRLERVVGPAYGEVAGMLGAIRAEVQERLPEPAQRAAFWDAALSLPLLDWAQAGQGERARQELRALLDRAIGGGEKNTCA